MDCPIPVPSECIDMLPRDLWPVWHECREQGWAGELPFCGPAKKRKIWKNYWHNFAVKQADDKPKFPDVPVPRQFWTEYCRKYPDGHADGEDKFERRWQHSCGWLDSKHGYFRSPGGGLIYRHPNGRIYQGLTGADELPACGCK